MAIHIREMKRYNDLYAKICDISNLERAAKEAARNKGDYYGVTHFNRHASEYLQELKEKLESKTYKTSEYKHRTIWERKLRTLSIVPYYPDNIVDHAIMQVIEPIVVGSFTADTYSCIRGRGTSGCMRAVDRMIAETKDWEDVFIFKCDVRHYFDTIDHELLKQIIRRKIKDKDLLWLLDEIIDSIDNVPIGRYLSQYTSNWFLTPFDHWVREVMPARIEQELGRNIGKFYYFRYMDDMTFACRDKEALHIMQREVKNKLAEYKLEMKHSWQIFRLAETRKDKLGRGLDFVGFVWTRKQKSIRKSIKLNFRKKVKKLKHVTKRQVSSYIGWVRYSNSKNLFNHLTKTNYYDFTKKRNAFNF